MKKLAGSRVSSGAAESASPGGLEALAGSVGVQAPAAPGAAAQKGFEDSIPVGQNLVQAMDSEPQISSAAGPDPYGSGPPGAGGGGLDQAVHLLMLSGQAGDPSVAPSANKGSLGIWPVFVKTVRHLFPNFTSWLKSLADPRDPKRIDYPISYVISSGILLFLTKLGARRQMRFQFKTEALIHNLNVWCETLCKTMLDPDTLAYLLKKLPPKVLEGLRHAMIYWLLRRKCFQKDRLLEQYYRIAIDGSGHLVFKERHCEHCLTQTQGNQTLYYHPALEAKLVTPSGLALSVGTEFLENLQESPDKQDCERKGFVRLAKQLKKDFPQLRICLLLDSLYVCQEVLDLCRDYDWRYIITFKEGSAPAVFGEYERLKRMGAQAYTTKKGWVQQTFWWVNQVEFGKHRVNVLECQEMDPKEGERHFVWITDLVIQPDTYAEVGNQGGRLRWKIENEGFNIQKNNGYEMEHVYCENEQAAKNFYLLLQIAHLLAQLMEKGLLAKRVPVLGGLRNVARFLLEELRNVSYDVEQLNRYLAQRIQIRLPGTAASWDTS